MPTKVTSWSVVFLKSKTPEGWDKPICTIVPPGLTCFIAEFLVTSSPTVSKTKSKSFSLRVGSLGVVEVDFKFFEHTSSRFWFG